MRARSLLTCWVIPATLLLGGCGGEEDFVDPFDQAFEQILKSVTGPWIGISTPQNLLSLNFTLTQSSSGSVTGSGTMKESAGANVPITITGSYQRPVLQLTFSGMVFEGRAVTGTFQGNYGIGGAAAGLRLTATGYDKTVSMLLQEQ